MQLLLRLTLPSSPPPPGPRHHHRRLRCPSLHSPLPPPLRLHPPPRLIRSPCTRLSCTPPAISTSFTEETDSNSDEELSRLLILLPDDMRRSVEDHPDRPHLVEVVMDLGRPPLARFPSGDFLLSDRLITSQDLLHATSQVGDFAADNRAGISRTLHRISAIRNRKGTIVGLTCRVGRAVSGSADLLRDLVKDGGSLLLIGPPGVGKTTIIRDLARLLADDYKKRVMIVDTSNEIGGDGDIPHAGIGSARRLQVPNSDMQHKVLIEAVENHMPQVIVIDEIGTKLEAMAASTIAQRGIQLVATAHGVTIENLIMNPSLEMLVGGIQSVTLGDEEASRRGVQKTVLERKGPSTFTSGAEIISKMELRVHRSLEATVDALLTGRSPNYEVRKINSKGLVSETFDALSELSNDIGSSREDDIIFEDNLSTIDEKISDIAFINKVAENLDRSYEDGVEIHLYAYGIPETSMMQAIKQLGMGEMITLTDNISEADVFLALHSKLKKNSQIQAAVKTHDIPVYVTKTTSLLQVVKAIRALVKGYRSGLKNGEEAEVRSSEETDALEEVRLAIEQEVIPKGEPMLLLPRPDDVISAQIDLIKKYKLPWERIGHGLNASLRILPYQDGTTRSSDDQIDEASDLLDGINGAQNGVARLPFLPE